MRYIIAQVMMLLVTVSLSAQTEHVRFLDVPLDGTIQQFQKELAAKGCRYDSATSAQLPKGIKAFKGSYANHDASMIIYHDETSGVVYQAMATISCYGEEVCESLFIEMNNQLQAQYGTLLSTKSIQYDHDSYGYTIMSNNREVIGVVGIFVTKDENTTDGYSVRVQYTDTANMRKHERLQENGS